MGRSRLYGLVIVACLTGWGWLGYYALSANAHETTEPDVCLIKSATGVPCPSCGTTRSVLAGIKGDWQAAFHWNPLGLILLPAMVIIPIWIIVDVVTGRAGFLKSYRNLESFLHRKWVYIPAIALMLANWIWNICKNL